MNVSDNKKTVTVIILTYMPKKTIINTIEMLLKQTYKIDQIIIINTEKELLYNNLDDTDKNYFETLLHKNIIKIYNINKSEFDHGKTRNFASEKTNTDLILYMTDDCIPYDCDLIKNMVESFNNNVAIVTARQIPKNDSKYIEKLVREFNYPDKYIIKNKNTEKEYGIKNYFCSNVCTMYDKSIFNKLGKFEENIPLNEDMLYAYKALKNGYSMVYNNKCIVYHSHNLTHIQQYNRNYLIGKSQKQFDYIFNNISSEKEGSKLVLYITKQCIKNFKFLSLVNFYIDCIYRYIGFINGKKSIKEIL